MWGQLCGIWMSSDYNPALSVLTLFLKFFICMFLFSWLCFELSGNDAFSLWLSIGPGEALAEWCGWVDPTVLPSILQRREHRLLSPPPWSCRDAVSLQVWSPASETTGPLGRRWRSRLVLPQPLHASSLRGWIRLLRTRARDLCVTTNADS